MQPPELLPIEAKDAFRFACHCKVPCFNHCCRDLNQALTPYDVLQLKNFLNISSQDFIETHALVYTGSSTGLPVVSLRFGSDQGKQCPFVTPEGCRVYPARPSSCRLYPLARALRRSRTDGRISAHYAIIKEAHCRGFDVHKTQTVGQWIANQQLETCLAMNDALMEIIALKNQVRPGPLSSEHLQMVQMAFYDLETLREKALTDELPGMDHDQLKALPDTGDDASWMKWGLQWVTRILFGNQRYQ